MWNFLISINMMSNNQVFILNHLGMRVFHEHIFRKGATQLLIQSLTTMFVKQRLAKPVGLLNSFFLHARATKVIRLNFACYFKSQTIFAANVHDFDIKYKNS